MLAGRYRALELGDAKGAFCGKILAGLGLDVIKVEPPAGSPERDCAPFYDDEPHREKSLQWFAYNGDKRGITLNLDTEDGRELFRRLAERVDFLIESLPPRYLDRLGLGWTALSERNPRLVYASITPFGQCGPYSDLLTNDLIVLALGGLLNINGEDDRAPLRFAVEQTFLQAGAQAAAGMLIALHYRAVTGRGQHVDVSMQEAICETLWMVHQFWDIDRRIHRREGSSLRRGATVVRAVYPCRDGFVSWRLFGGGFGKVTGALVDWMTEEGVADPALSVDWEAVDMNATPQGDVDRWEAAFGEFFLRHTKARLWEQSRRRGFMLFPMNEVSDLLRDPQLAARQFWVEVVHPELRAAIKYPGLPYRTTAALPSGQRRAPLLGEHNAEVYCAELGLSTVDLARLKQAGVI